jgi:hypothetical protein
VEVNEAMVAGLFAVASNYEDRSRLNRAGSSPSRRPQTGIVAGRWRPGISNGNANETGSVDQWEAR